MTVRPLPPERIDEAVAVLADAFRDYPVMRYVIGPAGEAYGERLDALVNLFVGARLHRGDPILSIEDGERVVAVATVTLPDEREASPAMATLREQVWRTLGPDARLRYDELGRIWQRFAMADRHHHLNMIGVRSTHAGRGLGRRLLDAVHDLARRDPASAGVTLTTEDPANVPLYQHVGYRILEHAQISPSFETWGFFRPSHA